MTKKAKQKNEMAKNEIKEIKPDPIVMGKANEIEPDQIDDIMEYGLYEALHVAMTQAQTYRITRDIIRMINSYYVAFCSETPFDANPLFDLLTQQTDPKKSSFRRAMAQKLDQYVLANKKQRT
jgi:hypothetical protein